MARKLKSNRRWHINRIGMEWNRNLESDDVELSLEYLIRKTEGSYLTPSTRSDAELEIKARKKLDLMTWRRCGINSGAGSIVLLVSIVRSERELWGF